MKNGNRKFSDKVNKLFQTAASQKISYEHIRITPPCSRRERAFRLNSTTLFMLILWYRFIYQFNSWMYVNVIDIKSFYCRFFWSHGLLVLWKMSRKELIPSVTSCVNSFWLAVLWHVCKQYSPEGFWLVRWMMWVPKAWWEVTICCLWHTSVGPLLNSVNFTEMNGEPT